MNKYYIFNKVFGINIEIDILENKIIKEDAECMIEVVLIDKIENCMNKYDSTIYQTRKDVYIFEYSDLIRYTISRTTIIVETVSKELFVSTFFNIPLSVYFMQFDELLLHSSAIVKDGSLYPFLGDKGAGKSTLMLSSIIYDENKKYFSDDAFLISIKDNEIIAYSSIKVIRATEETYKMLIGDGFDNHKKNLMGKAYVNVNFINESFEYENQLRKLFLLKRVSTNPTLHLNKITDTTLKKTLLISNIVGSKYFNVTLLKKVIKIIDKMIACNIDFYHLNIPNNLEYLREKFWTELDINEKRANYT